MYCGSSRDTAARIAAKHRSGSVGQLLGGGARRRGRPGVPEKDHKRANVTALRDLQRQLRQKEADKAAAAAEEPFKLRQFENVPSRLHRVPVRRASTPGASHGFGESRGSAPLLQALETASVCSTSPGGAGLTFTPPPRTFSTRIARGAGWGTPPPRQRAAQPAGGTPSPSGPAPRRQSAAMGRSRSVGGCGVASAAALDADCRDEDRREDLQDAAAFERSAEELRRLRLQQPRGSGLAGWSPAQHRAPPAWAQPAGGRRAAGDVGAPPEETPSAPRWWPAASAADLRAEADAEEEEARANVAAAEVPMGYRLLPEEERLETLSTLQDKLEELELRYTRLPLKIETEGARRHQQTLRTRIQETEDAIRLFSRPDGVLVEV